jgi:GNAT superfamily N-acetyltransferase
VGEAWLWYERRAMDDKALEAVIHDEGVEIYVLYVEGGPAGFAELDRRQEPDIELAYFGLVPEYIGRGLSDYLLSAAIDTAWSYEPKRVWLHTNTLDHPRALPLYQRLGFKPYRQEQKTFPDPRVTGLIPAAR